MSMRTFVSVFLAVAWAFSWESVCNAQAFFPLLRVDDTATDASVTVNLRSNAVADSSAGPGVNGPAIDSTEDDTNYAIANEISSAVDGDSNALSSSIAEAEVLPSASSSLMLAECISFVSGIWQLDSASYGSTSARNNQYSVATGLFEILENPTYPNVTLGTVQVKFDINFQSMDWDVGTIAAFCDDSYIIVSYEDGYYGAFGYLDGYGGVFDFDVADGPLVYTATFDVEVGHVIQLGSEIQVNTNPDVSVAGGAGTSAIPSMSLTSSCYVTTR